MPEKNGSLKCKKVRLSNKSDNVRLTACKTFAELRLESFKIASEIMAMQNPKHRFDRKRALHAHHTMIIDDIHKLEARMRQARQLEKPKKKWQINVLYEIQCSHVFEVEAENKLDACKKAEELCSNTDMLQYIQQGYIIETEIIGGPDV